MDKCEAAKAAIEAAGGERKLARQVIERRRARGDTKTTLTQQAVHAWKENGVSHRHVMDVEAITGHSRHDLRPDLYPREDAA